MERKIVFEWYCVHTHPTQEQLAKTHLEQQGFKVFLPLDILGKQVLPLFPGYLFVSFTRHDRWQSILSTMGVKTIFTHLGPSGYQTPTSIALEVIAAIRLAAAPAPIPQDEEEIIHPGMIVKVAHGPFKGFEGIVKMSKQNRVYLLISILGQQQQVQMHRGALVSAS